MNNDDAQYRASIASIALQIFTIFLSVIVGGLVAIMTVMVFANLFQPFKKVIPVAFVCVAIF